MPMIAPTTRAGCQEPGHSPVDVAVVEVGAQAGEGDGQRCGKRGAVGEAALELDDVARVQER